MKKTTLALTFATLITLAGSAQALELMVVKDYNGAANEAIWKKAKTDEVPAVLLGNESIAAPTSSYSQLFPKTFLQEPLFAVCFQNCDNKDIFKIQNGEMNAKDKVQLDVIEQSNVYYWLGKYFNFIDNGLQFELRHYLKIMTNRQIKDETKGKNLKNNAFFNPKDITLSFLPASNNLLFKLMGGKLNRSGFDPSVIAHEASHYLFHHLFPNPVNEEISGLNEGFADYGANIFLENPKVGLVMMHGKAMRDASAQTTDDGKLKTYSPGLQSHELGERVAFALWKTREASSNKVELDKLVLDAVKSLNTNPYSTVHDFKMKMLERLPSVLDNQALSDARALWEIVFPGMPAKIDNFKFLDQPTPATPNLGFTTVTQLPPKLAQQYGVPARDESHFDIHQLVEVSSTQFAIQVSNKATVDVPYWVVLDSKSANVLGVYDSSRRLMNNSQEIEKIISIATTGKTVASTIQDFKSKASLLADFANGKGQFDLVYKKKSTTILDQMITFNGSEVSAKKIHIEMKRKLLTGVLFGLPNINSVDVMTIPSLNIKSLPELNGQTVIGYKLQFETGTAVEVLLNKYH